MNAETSRFVMEKTKALVDAHTASAEAREAGNAWLAAVGTGAEAEESKKYLAMLEACIMPIDTLIAFAGSAAGEQYFGAQTAAGIASHAREVKAAGADYCDCPACAATAAILEKKPDMLA